MSKRILVADDEPETVKMLTSRLKANGYEVIETFDGMYTMAEAISKKPELILLDYRMPAGDGVYIHEKLKTWDDTAKIPVILITAYPNEEVKRKVLEAGVEDFITKPFDADELLGKVRKALKES